MAFDGRVSRRSLLSKAGAAAVAAVAAGTLLNPREAKANHFSSAYFEATFIRTHHLEAINNNNQWAVKAAATGDHFGAVDGTNNAQSGVGVEGNSTGVEGTGVRGAAHKFGVRGVGLISGGTGVKGEGDTGVWGSSSRTSYSGVYGQHSGVGYEAFGVKGETTDAIGVKGIGRNGVVGESPAGGHAAVYGHHTGSSGYGVIGDGTGPSAGVLGRNSSGYGGEFEGGKAQLKLKPAGSTGKPSGAHAKGEIYMDKAGALFVCVAGGTPGRWRKLTSTAV